MYGYGLSTLRRSPVRSLISFIVLVLTAFCAQLPLAHAAVITDRPLLFKFNGSDTTAGAFKDESDLEINQATGDVFVLDEDRNVLDKFGADGVAKGFSATGKSSLDIPLKDLHDGGVAIDNSSSSTSPGRIYVQAGEGDGMAFEPTGDSLPWRLQRGKDFTTGCAAAFDSKGRLWVSDRGANRLREFEAVGLNSPKQIGSFPYVNGGSFPCSIDLNSTGDLYVAVSDFGKGVYKYVAGAYQAPPLDSQPSAGVAVSQVPSPGEHIFTSHQNSFNEYDSGGVFIGAFGGSVISNGEALAYNVNLDRVYVANFSGHVVYAFGPKVTGTVPDVAVESATGVEISKAEFNGKVNPQSIANDYFFEWKPGTETTNWGEAHASAPQSLPEDSTSHTVSFDANGLKGDTTYQVRLVGVNTDNKLRAVSSAATFKTAKAPGPPVISKPTAGTVTAESVEVEATVDPQQDFGTTYQLQLSTLPDCDSDFVSRPLRGLESETSVTAAETISGLLPAQHYCVRIVATNSFGSSTSAVEEFTTAAVPASEASPAFVAPRLDTSVRLNARVNPEGAPFSYRFEYSEDGGGTWILLPEGESASHAREQIVVGTELGGLEPGTTYLYRLASVENEGGATASLGAEKAFTTRSTAEVEPPSPCPNEALRTAQHTDSYLGQCRGIELVNSSEKGTQNVRAESIQGNSPLSEDGESALWNVLAGAPGGNVGSGAAFIATRTGPTATAPNGWQSRAVVPTAQEGEEGGYRLGVFTPGLSAFVFNAGIGALENGESREFVWVDAGQHLRQLKQFSVLANAGKVDMTADGGHVLFVDKDGFHQLLDLGGGGEEEVSLMPDGGLNECGLDVNNVNRSFIGGGSAEGAALLWQAGYHMIATTDASRVYFQAKPNGQPCGSSLYGIYERNRETEETVLVDPGDSGHSPNFIRATPDGRQAFFATYSKLDPADLNFDPDVYRWDEGAETSTCLTCVALDADVALTLRGVLVSDDSSHVYFESLRQLVPGEGRAGDLNVYSLSAGQIHFVADVNAASGILQGPTTLSGPAQISADGNVLVFETSNDTASHQELTADPLAAQCALLKATTPQPCEELIRYDDRDGSLECLSCRYGGLTENSVGVASAPAEHEYKLSADGSTVAFTTAEALTPRDVNRTTDVYEWRNGVRSLISDGVTTYPQSFTASPQLHAVGSNGRDILFSIVDPSLTGFERDGFASLYDARIGGGFTVPNPPAHCSEESCQGPLQPAPGADRTNSLNFVGEGNVPAGPRPRPCAHRHGKAKRRCMAKHKRRSQRAGAAGKAGRSK